MSTLSTFSDIWRSFHIFPQSGVPVRSTCRASRPHGPAFSPAALRPTKYQGCRLRRPNPSKSSAYVYIFLCFNMLSSHPHILRHERQTRCSATWSLFCPRWFTVRLLFTRSLVCPFVTSLFWCSAAQPRKLFHSMLPFVSIWEKKVAIVIASAKWDFRHRASHYLVTPSALKMLIIW